MFEFEIYRGVMCHKNEEWCKIWRGIDLSIQNWHEEFDKFWVENLKISKICTLMSCFWPQYIMFELKKYREVMFDCSEDWCKIWRKTDLHFLKWHEEFWKFLFASWKMDFILESKTAELNKNKCSTEYMFHRIIVLKVWENFQESCQVM